MPGYLESWVQIRKAQLVSLLHRADLAFLRLAVRRWWRIWVVCDGTVCSAAPLPPISTVTRYGGTRYNFLTATISYKHIETPTGPGRKKNRKIFFCWFCCTYISSVLLDGKGEVWCWVSLQVCCVLCEVWTLCWRPEANRLAANTIPGWPVVSTKFKQKKPKLWSQMKWRAAVGL